MTRTSPLIIAALLTAVGTASAQSVTVYGRISQFGTHVRTDGSASREELRDHASRLGFMGREDLGDGLSAIFGLEMGLSADTGMLTDPPYRNSYVGLNSTRYGMLALGRLDSGSPIGSPIYTPVVRTVDFVGYDASTTAISTAVMLNSRNRTSNSIGYTSPTFSGLTGRARVYLRGAGTTAEPEDAARSLDLGLEYGSGPLFASLSHGKDQRRGGLLANEFDDKWQLTGRYTIEGFSPYAIYGVDRFNQTSTTRRRVAYWLAGVSYAAGPHKGIVNIMNREVQTSRTAERKRWQAAYIYSLSKRTELQAFVDQDGVDSSRLNVKIKAAGLGIRHTF